MKNITLNHPLDNPVWNALVSGNQNLSRGNDIAKWFEKDVSPFAAIKENTPDYFTVLASVVPRDTIAIMSDHPLQNIPSWHIVDYIPGLQMIFEKHPSPEASDHDSVSLGEEHVSEMIELTQLTNPGPFSKKTIQFGHYEGIFENEKLVSLAGQRLHANEFAEISAVCTRPGYNGRGFARTLVLRQILRIQSVSGVPFLHVREVNTRAINIYKEFGFVTRMKTHIYILRKTNGFKAAPH